MHKILTKLPCLPVCFWNFPNSCYHSTVKQYSEDSFLPAKLPTVIATCKGIHIVVLIPMHLPLQFVRDVLYFLNATLIRNVYYTNKAAQWVP